MGQEKVALMITGAGVVARKLTSQTTSASVGTAPPAPRWLFITVIRHAAGLSRTMTVSRLHR